MKRALISTLLLATIAVTAVVFAQEKPASPEPTPTIRSSALRAMIDVGQARVEPVEYRVVALPVRPQPRPLPPQGNVSTEDWQRVQREIRISDETYAKVLDAFFGDMADHDWHFVTFLDGQSIALFELRLMPNP